MQTVSQSWKNVHKQTLLNESFVEVSLDIADPDALEDASPVDNGAVYISNISEAVGEVNTSPIPYGTLEQNSWLLNGSRKSIPSDVYMDGGFVGDVLSNEECVFDTKIPTITINFSKVFTKIIPGVTIVWGTAYNEYPEQFVVTAYEGNNVVAEQSIIDNKSVTTIVNMDIEGYDRIVIRVLSWCLPNHRVRIDEIFLGTHKIYSKTDLMSYSHSQKVDPISTSLPKMEIKFSIDNSDDSYNPSNPNGLSKYLTERQEVKARYGLKLNDNTIEWINAGVFYLSEWYAKQNGISADFVARDLFEFMSAHYKDNFEIDGSEIKGRSLYDLAESVLNAASLPLNSDGTKKWVIDDSLKEITTTAPLPDDTIANCLQMIANMGQCVLYPDRDGTIHIESINDTNVDYAINQFNSYSKSEITISKQLHKVIVKIYSYSIDENGELKSSTIASSNHIFEEVGEIITVDNPLITSGEYASRLGAWMGNYLKNRMTLKSTVRADVSLDVLDKVAHENNYSTETVRVTDVELTYNGAFRGTIEGRVI